MPIVSSPGCALSPRRRRAGPSSALPRWMVADLRARGTRAEPARQATPVGATPVLQRRSASTLTGPGLQQRSPGDLVAYEELAGHGDPNFRPASRIWRVLYVSTGRDNTERTLVCGVVIAPSDGPRVFDGPDGPRGRVVSWSHGTRGLIPRCLPSSDPAGSILGPDAGRDQPGGLEQQRERYRSPEHGGGWHPGRDDRRRLDRHRQRLLRRPLGREPWCRSSWARSRRPTISTWCAPPII